MDEGGKFFAEAAVRERSTDNGRPEFRFDDTKSIELCRSLFAAFPPSEDLAEARDDRDTQGSKQLDRQKERNNIMFHVYSSEEHAECNA